MSETTFKSFIGQNVKFLENNVSFSCEDLLDKIDGFESYKLDSDDKKIIKKILLEIKSANTFSLVVV